MVENDGITLLFLTNMW